MIINNALIYTEDKGFLPGSIAIENGRFGNIVYTGDKSSGAQMQAGAGASPAGRAFSTTGAGIDADGCYAIPGLIDVHLHGCVGYNFYDATFDELCAMFGYLASNGVTSLSPTTLTLPEDILTQACLSIAAAARKIDITPALDNPAAAAAAGDPKDTSAFETGGANSYFNLAAPVGIYLEGPFLSPLKSGAQNPAYATLPDVAMLNRLRQASGDLVKIIAVAPEIDGALDFIEAVAGEIVVAIAHTGADYDTTVAAFKRGAKHVTHLYNAMSAFNHRDPNVVGAVFDNPEVTAELVGDGVHLHPAAVRVAIRLLGTERLIIVSDSMAAAGLGEGVYDLGGLSVRVSGKEARLVGAGNIAGSASNLMDCLRVAVKEVGMRLEDAVRCASLNPARLLDISGERGQILEGMIADLVLLDTDLNIKEVFVRGYPLMKK